MTKKEIARLEKEAKTTEALLQEKSQDCEQVITELKQARAQLAGFEANIGDALLAGADLDAETKKQQDLQVQVPALEKKLLSARKVVKSAQAAHDKAILAAGQAKVKLFEQNVSDEVLHAHDAVDMLAASAVKIHDIRNVAVGVYSDEVKPYLKADDRQVWEKIIRNMRKFGRIFEAAAKHARVVKKPE